MSEVFRSLTDGIWSELGKAGGDDAKGRPVALSTIRRNLQREHLKKLSSMVLGTRRNPFEDMYGYIVFFGTPAPPPTPGAWPGCT